MKVKISKLQNLALKALSGYGYTNKEAKIILDVLMYAQLRNNNQGLVKLIGKGIPKDPGAGKIKILKQAKLSALLDGSKNMGILAMREATRIALEKAKKNGFGIVGINNTYSSTGAIGYYVKEIAKQGFLGFAFSGSPPRICHYGSCEPKYGTNPLAIGIPTEKEPLVLDMATAAIAYYGLIEAKTAGKQISKNTAYDQDGQPTTDPEKALEGAILPFDRSYKGAGLAMVVEILTNLWSGANFVGIGKKGDDGSLIFGIDPELLMSKGEFKKRVSQLIRNVKNSKRLPGVREILVPGERGNKLTQQRLKSREIEIEDNLYKELKKAAEKK